MLTREKAHIPGMPFRTFGSSRPHMSVRRKIPRRSRNGKENCGHGGFATHALDYSICSTEFEKLRTHTFQAEPFDYANGVPVCARRLRLESLLLASHKGVESLNPNISSAHWKASSELDLPNILSRLPSHAAVLLAPTSHGPQVVVLGMMLTWKSSPSPSRWAAPAQYMYSYFYTILVQLTSSPPADFFASPCLSHVHPRIRAHMPLSMY